MKNTRYSELSLILIFLAIIVSVPLVQVATELRQGERPQALEVFSRKPTSANFRAYEHHLEDASWAAARLRPWAQYAHFAWLQDGGEKALVGREGWLFYKPGVQYLTERPRGRHGSLSPTGRGQGEGESTPADAVAAITAFRDQLAARGIRLLVMPAPNKESVYPEKLTRRAEGFRGALCAETQSVLTRLNAAGVEVVDLFDLFAAAKHGNDAVAPSEGGTKTPSRGGEGAGGGPLYLSQDSHWSPAGVELAAKAVAQRILARGWVMPGTVAYEGRPVAVTRTGDILRMLQVPELERAAPPTREERIERREESMATNPHSSLLTPLFSPENIQCTQVVRRDTGQAYQDDPDSEILVLGDSFLRIFEKDEPGAAGFVAHLSRALGKPCASIINDGGASTLARQELYRRPRLLANKKLVIWEFVERDIRLGTEGWQLVPLPNSF